MFKTHLSGDSSQVTGPSIPGNSDSSESGAILSESQIRFECQIIQKRWSEWEKELRRIRSEMACRCGVCRNL